MESASHLMRLPMGESTTNGAGSFPDECFRFGRGEGAVAIVLKPLEDAIRDQDHIYATVSFSGSLLSMHYC